MESRLLGRNGPEVPVLCLGTWPLGGGYGYLPRDRVISTIHAAINSGMNFVDTAEGYENSEHLLGIALKGRRSRVFLATKLTGDHSTEHMFSAIENSLRSLQTDYIDLYQLHSPRPDRPIEETMDDLLKLKKEGKIRYIGVSNFSADQHIEAFKAGPINSSQPRYNMLFRSAEESILTTCRDMGVGVIVHSPLAKGMLTGKYIPGHRFPPDDERNLHSVFQTTKFKAAQPYLQKLVGWAADHGHNIAELAIAWTLANPAVTSSIVGAKTPEQVVANLEAANWYLTSTDLAEIEGIFEGFSLDGKRT